ncbi:hypothetical protein [Burkholderia sp. BCC0419]|uniref:hypothetical protein n=1 Tax=Burkholderia sp. BCC0419 TaxID=486878 RepID=UPI00158D77C9|nr:hypothetical protein [Burkholderia sp. BCC0419]
MATGADKHAGPSVVTVRHHWRENVRAAVRKRRALMFAEFRIAIDWIHHRQNGDFRFIGNETIGRPNKIVPPF